jgi:hypothetical protein
MYTNVRKYPPKSNIVCPNLTSLTKTSSRRPSDYIDIDSSAQPVTHIGNISGLPSEWWLAPTTNTNTCMRDANNPVMGSDEEVLNISRNILDNEVPKVYRQAISGPNDDLWHSPSETDIDALCCNHTWDVVNRPTHRKCYTLELDTFQVLA